MNNYEEIALLIHERNFRSEQLRQWFIETRPERGTVYPTELWIRVMKLAQENCPNLMPLTDAQDHQMGCEIRYQILQLEIMMTGVTLQELLEIDQLLDERDNYVESTLNYMLKSGKS